VCSTEREFGDFQQHQLHPIAKAVSSLSLQIKKKMLAIMRMMAIFQSGLIEINQWHGLFVIDS
jgi:hypothetical protein